MRALEDCYLYGILDTGYCEPGAMPAMLERMAAGGVDIVQLRAKNQPEDRVEELTRELHPIARARGIPFILNDWPAIAGRAGVEGAHVGVEDMTVAEARRLAGRRCLIGKSSHSLEQAEAGAAQGADYLGFGPLFATPTKPDYHPIGTHDIQEVHRRLTLPIFCIGGIKLENLPAVLAAGARRAVIVSGLLQAPDVTAYARTCAGLLRSNGAAGGALAGEQ
ncbi:MAG: thiamine-phosphate pyrophosphorylase [Verrucomicrobiales bacterium]|nr:thiamine-phosphate pyrophosphorylase [Verrucomicrobiales bacterium]